MIPFPCSAFHLMRHAVAVLLSTDPADKAAQTVDRRPTGHNLEVQEQLQVSMQYDRAICSKRKQVGPGKEGFLETFTEHDGARRRRSQLLNLSIPCKHILLWW